MIIGTNERDPQVRASTGLATTAMVAWNDTLHVSREAFPALLFSSVPSG